jgi:biopolymer transport protein ExbD
MAMSAGSDRDRPVAAINVTPLIDVIIVLLIIFMVTVPMLGQDDRVRLPDARNSVDFGRTGVLAIRIRDDGSVLVGDRRLDTLALLAVELRDRPELVPESAARTIRIEADESLPYSRVQEVLDACREAGARELLLVTAARRVER